MSDAAKHVDLLFPSKYLRGADLMGRDVVVTIASVTVDEVVRAGGGKEKKPHLRFEGKEKSLILNRTNAKVVAALYGKFTDAWVGKRITLFDDPSVRFGPEVTGGIRVRPAVPKDKP